MSEVQKPHISPGYFSDPRIDLIGTLRGHVILEMDDPRKTIALEQLDELGRRLEQLEAAQQECEDWRRRFTQMADSAFALANPSAVQRGLGAKGGTDG